MSSNNIGFSGPSVPGIGLQYFLGSAGNVINCVVNVTDISNKYLVNASCQLLSDTSFRNVSASILRSGTAMFGTGLPISYINLSNDTKTDVIFPPLHTGTSNLNDLNTSLWSYSVPANQSSHAANGMTINMQAFDTGVSGHTGPNYYAIRVDTDKSELFYGNIKISVINLN